jgi:malate dehydrogenase
MVKVCVIGAAGGIGQPLALLCKLNPMVTELALFDVVPLVKGVSIDLSHIDTQAKTVGYTPTSRTDTTAMKAALKDSHVVLIPAGVPRKPGMTRDDLFKINAGIVQNIAENAAEACPGAFIGIISNPVNSTVPIFCEVFK